MFTPLLAPALVLGALALQDAPVTAAPVPPEGTPVSLDALPIEQAAAARCAIAFATIGRWQREGDSRGAQYPDMATTGGREFFVRVMAKLMDEAGFTREDIVALSAIEVARNDSAAGTARIAQMMPACELMKSTAGL